ncbi:hypothetical protein D1P53_004728 [Cryptococcus gattii VGV]|nr:hypothetical protein D1P53_004728 [Cryptococcus gattii VGV]
MPRSSNPRASSSSNNPYSRSYQVVEAASIGPGSTLPLKSNLNHRIKLEFSRAPNQSLSSSSGEEHDVAASNLSPLRHSDDVSIPRHSPPVGQSPSLPDDAYPPSPTGQEVSQGSLEREPMDIDDGQGNDDLPFIMVDEPVLQTGVEGDGDAGVIRDRLGHQLGKWPTKIPESLIPSYSGRQPNPYHEEPIFRTGPATRSMPLLTTVLAVFSVFLTTFVGLPQQFGDMGIRRPQSLPAMREKIYNILNLPFETSSSRFGKNVKTLYAQLDIDPSMVIHPKCPTKECQNVFIDVVDKDGWDKIPDNCPEGRRNAGDRVDNHSVQRERDCLVLTINVSIDWADPSKSRNRSARSMGPIMCQLADQPNKYRSQYSFAMLMGITPAPNEPPAGLLHRPLLPLAVDLLSAEGDGLWIRTPKYPNGRKVYIRIGTICCDRPASVAVTGCAYFKRNDSPCLKCTVPASQLPSIRKHPARSSAEHSEAMLARHHEFLRQFEQAPQTARQTHVARRAGHLTKATEAHIATLEKSIFAVPGHLSVFDLFPDFDKVRHAVVDPMHALLEGILPFYLRKVMVLGKDCAVPPAGWAEDDDVASVCTTDSEGEGSVDEDRLRDVYDEMVDQSGASEEPGAIEKMQRYAARVLPRSKTDGKPIFTQAHLCRLEQMMEEVVYPPYIDRIAKQFFTTTEQANRSSVENIRRGPGSTGDALALGRSRGRRGVASTGRFSSISEAQVAQLRQHIDNFRSLVSKLHPFLPARVTDFHAIQHIPDDILAHGPVFGWWLFALERLNGNIKHIKMGGRNMVQEQVVALRALLRQR